jgi:hypothetical protein
MFKYKNNKNSLFSENLENSFLNKKIGFSYISSENQIYNFITTDLPLLGLNNNYFEQSFGKNKKDFYTNFYNYKKNLKVVFKKIKLIRIFLNINSLLTLVSLEIIIIFLKNNF